MRRLPIFLVIDVSESMAGDNLRYMQEGIKRLIASLRTDPHALETVYLSIIAFAGVAGTIVPLTELFAFYPPRLPLGSGTSIGAALNQLMDEIQFNVKRGDPSRKGDYKPIAFFLSDGKSTDNPDKAILRWQQDFQHRATLISIGIGPYADLTQLSVISDNVLRLEKVDESDFHSLIQWVSHSISVQSRSLGLNIPITLEKKEQSLLNQLTHPSEETPVDEDYAIITGICSKTKLPYLMKYERLPPIEDIPFFTKSNDTYFFKSIHAAEQDFFDWSDPRANTRTIASSMLYGGGGCPHCGARFALATCSCGQVMCVEGDGEVLCPGCNQLIEMGTSDEDFDIARARG